MGKIPTITIYSRNEWRAWLEKNHTTEEKAHVIHHKKHTGKTCMTHREGIEEALCFGWIDTIVKRINEDTYQRTFVKRGDKANWSVNTLGYAQKLLAEGNMTPAGIKRYHEGLKKKPFGAGRVKNPETPPLLLKALKKQKGAEETFKGFAPSYRRTLIYWLENAKLPETQQKRISAILQRVKENKRKW